MAGAGPGVEHGWLIPDFNDLGHNEPDTSGNRLGRGILLASTSRLFFPFMRCDIVSGSAGHIRGTSNLGHFAETDCGD